MTTVTCYDLTGTSTALLNKVKEVDCVRNHLADVSCNPRKDLL